jgi:hypothetical protein
VGPPPLSDTFTEVNNTDQVATYSVSLNLSGSLSTTVGGEVGLQVGPALEQISAKFHVDVTATATVSHTDTFSVPVAPHESVTRAGPA